MHALRADAQFLADPLDELIDGLRGLASDHFCQLFLINQLFFYLASAKLHLSVQSTLLKNQLSVLLGTLITDCGYPVAFLALCLQLSRQLGDFLCGRDHSFIIGFLREFLLLF